MDERWKRLLLGFGIMFGMQFLAAFFGLKLGQNFPETTFYIMLGFTLAAYFGGGLVMGLLADHVIILEPLLVSLLAITLNTTISALSATQAGESAGTLQFADVLLMAYALKKGAVLSLLFAMAAVVIAALAGALVGERIATPTYDWISTAAPIVGLVSLVIGPIFLLAFSGTEKGNPAVPWPFLIIIMLAFVIVVGVGYLLFTREHNEAEEISISPDHRRDLS